MNVLQNWFQTRMGVDLGTANTLIYVKDRGIALREPSVIAMDSDSSMTLAVGVDARSMIGRTPAHVRATRPLKHGVVSELPEASSMLNKFIQSLRLSRTAVRNPEVVMAVPAGITSVEKIAIKQIAENAHASRVYLPSEPLCAAIGAELPVNQPVGSMIVDIGGGTTEVAVISLGAVVVHQSIRIAGDEFDEAIVQYLKDMRKIDIGQLTAEDIKFRLGSAWSSESEEEDRYNVCGINVESGIPVMVSVTRREIREALTPPLSKVVKAIKDTLEQTPAELAADIVDHGMILVGGGAYLHGLDQLISNETGLPVSLPPDPIACVAEGTGRLFDPLYDRVRELCECYR